MMKDYLLLKNFLSKSDLLKILKDVELNFKNNVHDDNLNSGVQTTPDLHLINKETHWLNFFGKLTIEMNKFNKKSIHKCWGLKVDRKQKSVYHKHGNFFTSVFYLQNKDFNLGTHLKYEENEMIIPGYENSILIFDGNILHDAVFPVEKLQQPRYTLITDYE